MCRFMVLLMSVACLALAGLANSAENDFGVAAMATRKEGDSLLDHYRKNIEYSWFMCTAARIAGKDVAGYVNAHKAALKEQYAAAAKTIKKPAAKAALKEHFVQAMSLVEGVEPGISEARIDYDRRQTDNKENLKKAWTRVEIEL